MTKQEILDQIEKRNGFMRCANGSGCFYRHPDKDQACLVGAFIPDALCKPWFEKTDVEELINNFPELDQHMPLHKKHMLKLQEIHDACFTDNKECNRMLVSVYLDRIGVK